MEINYPNIDWLTITSWENEDFFQWNRWLSKQDGQVTAGKIKMYSGLWVGSCFVGQGYQGDKNHFIARVSGESSSNVFHKLYSPGVKATRIDVQITKELPPGYSARKFVDSLRSKDWGVYKRDLQLIENSDGLDTVYIGSKKSDRFARVYVKSTSEGNFLRFETENKKDLADSIAMAYYKDQNVLSSVLYDFISSLPLDDEGVLQGFLDLINDVRSGIVVPRKVVTADSTYTWLVDQVGPVIWKYLNDHDRGADLASFLIKMIYESSAGKSE